MMMIKDVMVWLDGGISDEIRLAAVADIARRLESQVIIGLFLNPLPLPAAVDADVAASVATAELMERARGRRQNRGVAGQAATTARSASRDQAVRCIGRRHRQYCYP